MGLRGASAGHGTIPCVGEVSPQLVSAPLDAPRRCGCTAEMPLQAPPLGPNQELEDVRTLAEHQFAQIGRAAMLGMTKVASSPSFWEGLYRAHPSRIANLVEKGILRIDMPAPGGGPAVVNVIFNGGVPRSPLDEKVIPGERADDDRDP